MKENSDLFSQQGREESPPPAPIPALVVSGSSARVEVSVVEPGEFAILLLRLFYGILRKFYKLQQLPLPTLEMESGQESRLSGRCLSSLGVLFHPPNPGQSPR